MWHYLYFIVLVQVKDPTDFTGPESYVYNMIKVWSLNGKQDVGIEINKNTVQTIFCPIINGIPLHPSPGMRYVNNYA